MAHTALTLSVTTAGSIAVSCPRMGRRPWTTGQEPKASLTVPASRIVGEAPTQRNVISAIAA